MTTLDERPPVRRLPPSPPRGPAVWLRDLAMGLRFGAFGGREAWARNGLTALGVGLGVALLLVAASLPQIVNHRELLADARSPAAWGGAGSKPVPPSATTLVWASGSTEYRDELVDGLLLRADGDRPKLPPGVERIPGPGEMTVSPALAELLRSPEGRMLAERLDRRITGTIGYEGLLDPGDLYYYAGSSTLTAGKGGVRTDGFGQHFPYDRVQPLLAALATLICVVLLSPVAVFIGVAVRFGGERRDRRLAALRLVGADARSTRRIAAGESLFGALLGLAVGAGIFAVARLFAGSVRIWGLSAFPEDVVPMPELAALLAVMVPAASVAVTLIALRSVVVEPLGVMRRAAVRRRRLWWRLLLPASGAAVLLAPGAAPGTTEYELLHPLQLAVGAALVLFGVTALFPWVVETVVNRLRGGPVSWQLAVRALQLRGGTASRSVSGIMVAVTGAITLQMVFAGMHDEFTRTMSNDPGWGRVNVEAEYPDIALADRMTKEFRAADGVRDAHGMVVTSVSSTHPGPVAEDDPPPVTTLTVARCPVLRDLARIRSCEDGDVFVVRSGDERYEHGEAVDRVARKGEDVLLGEIGERTVRWPLPKDAPTVRARSGVTGYPQDGIYATPGALGAKQLPGGRTTAVVQVDESDPQAHDQVRNTAARIEPRLRFWTLRMIERDQKYDSIQTGLLAGASATMLLIAASMLVAQAEELRERRRLLSVLVAFGARRATLVRSLLWQTALPVVLGTAVATASGLLLGTVMLRLLAKEVTRWWLFLPVAATGAGVIALVTLLSLPSLWRMTRPDGLRTE